MIAYASSHTAVAEQFVSRINEVILFPLITLLLVVALLVFLYGCFEYVIGSANETARETGKKHLLWGLVGLLVMLSAYAILSIAANTFGIDVPDPITESPFAPSESPFPAARPESRAPTNAPEPTARPQSGACQQYSAAGCTPSNRTEPYQALREEIQYTGGIAGGTSGLSAVQAVLEGNGSLELGLQFMDEYRRENYVSQETYDRVVEAMQAASPRTLEEDEFRNRTQEAINESGSDR